MHLSLEDLFSDEQSIGTAAPGDVASTNVLDWASHKDDDSRDLTLFAKCDVIGTFGSSGTLTMKFQTSSDNSTFVTLATTAALTTPLVAGTFYINQPLPTGLLRYNRMFYTVGTAAFAVTCKITAGIVRGPIDKAFAGI